MAASPPPSSATVRRNPTRRARPPTTPARSATRPRPPPLSRLLDEAAAASTSAAAISSTLPPPPPTPPAPYAGISPVLPAPPPTPSASAVPTALSTSSDERLKVYLRIRPLPAPAPAPERGGKPGGRPKAKEQQQPRRPPPRQAGPGDGVCLVATGPSSVALTVPQCKVVDSKRGRVATEVFDGFSAVLPPESSQHDIFTQVMNPLVDEFLGGKSGLLVAMGPTGSGKTHTVFGTVRNPGIVPQTLHKIFSEINSGNQTTRSFCLSMFEILCEGKSERIVDLLSDGADLVLQQSTAIKGLKEVAIPNCMDAESLVARGMLKRSTAATNANSESSRSQCIITIRAIHKNSDQQSEHPLAGSVLTIADLAGAERKKSTGNMGSRLLESNFINNTSMVFGNCLRALLDQQKNQKKTLEKHFKNSMFTRYLRDYLEGRKKMTLLSTQLVVEEVSEESACYDPERSSAYCDMQGKSVDCDISATNSINEQELSSRYLKTEESCIPDAFEPQCDGEKGDTEGAAQKNPEEPESVSAGRCEPTVEKTIAEREAAAGGQRLDGVLDGRPPQPKTWTAPTTKDRRQAAEGTRDEKENCPAAARVITDRDTKEEGRQVQGAQDVKEEGLCAPSKPSEKTKKPRRRLLPVSSMMLKEFTGPHIDAAVADTKRAAVDGGAAGDGRSEKLIRLLAESTSAHQASLITVANR